MMTPSIWLCGTSKLLEDVVPLAEEKENQDPAPEVKRAKLDVSPRSNKQSKRFEKIAASPELASSSKGYIPPNTEANTQWAVRTFVAAKPKDPVPEDILSELHIQRLLQSEITKTLVFASGLPFFAGVLCVTVCVYQYKLFCLLSFPNYVRVSH